MNPANAERGVAPWKQPNFDRLGGLQNMTTSSIDTTPTEIHTILDKHQVDLTGLNFGSGSVVRLNHLCSYQITGGSSGHIFICLNPSVTPNIAHATAPVTTPRRSAKDLLSLIKDRLNLNVTQMAKVCRVQRPTIYEWFEGTTPRRSNLKRIAMLAEIAEEYDFPNSGLFRESLLIPTSGSDLGILDQLSSDSLDCSKLRKQLDAIKAQIDMVTTPSILQSLQDSGYSELSPEESAENLQSAADLDLGP